ncbi:MAG: hypothetical protein SOX84_08380 [Prevotella sp.]|nr:hypothetical protein [Prevotella sp.]MDY4218776.1 hypothetical protein [Prevotella sp.]
MKQFKFKTFGVVALLAITACTSESNFNQVVEEQQTPQTQLKVQSQESALEALKGEIIITREEHFPTQIGRERGWFKKFFSRVLNVVFSDVSGFIKGAINGQDCLETAKKASTKAGVEMIHETAQDLLATRNDAPRAISLHVDSLKNSRFIDVREFVNLLMLQV